MQWQQKAAIRMSGMTYTISEVIQKQKSLWKELLDSLRNLDTGKAAEQFLVFSKNLKSFSLAVSRVTRDKKF